MSAPAAQVERLVAIKAELLAIDEGIDTSPPEALPGLRQRVAEFKQEVARIGAEMDAEEVSGDA